MHRDVLEEPGGCVAALEKQSLGTSLKVQWLRVCASNARGVHVQSLAGELRSHMLCGVAVNK